MLRPDQKRKMTGIGLIVIGALFLLGSNDVWLGWANVWPLFPILAGMLFLRVYSHGKTPEMLFGGITTLLMGVFLLFFSLNIFPWSRMDALWPVIPAIGGVALLAVAAAHFHGTGAMIAGVVFILFAFLGILHEAGVINQRVISPFVRLWPLVLVVAGVTLLRTKPSGEDADMKAVREVLDRPEEPPVPAPEPSDEKSPTDPS